MIIDTGKHTRRAFLQRSGQLAMVGAATPFALNLAAIGEAAALDATDYRALVCVFLYGGNDYANTVVNHDSANHARYAAIRGAAASAGGPNIAIRAPTSRRRRCDRPRRCPGGCSTRCIRA